SEGLERGPNQRVFERLALRDHALDARTDRVRALDDRARVRGRAGTPLRLRFFSGGGEITVTDRRLASSGGALGRKTRRATEAVMRTRETWVIAALGAASTAIGIACGSATAGGDPSSDPTGAPSGTPSGSPSSAPSTTPTAVTCSTCVK